MEKYILMTHPPFSSLTKISRYDTINLQNSVTCGDIISSYRMKGV